MAPGKVQRKWWISCWDGMLHPALDTGVNAKVVFDAIWISDICGPVASSWWVHFISVRDMTVQGVVQTLYVLGARDVSTDGPATG